MTLLLGTITDSVGNPLDCYIQIILMAPIVNKETSPFEVRYKKGMVYHLPTGSFSGVFDLENNPISEGIDLLPTEETTYKFSSWIKQLVVVYFLNGTQYDGAYHQHTDNLWYTGTTHNQNSELLDRQEIEEDRPLFDPIYATIPDQVSIEWGDIQHTSINTSNIDTSARYIADLIATNHADQVNANLAIPQGDYDNTALYKRFDIVYNPLDNGVYWFISDTPLIGSDLVDPAIWMKVGQFSTDTGGFTPDDVLLSDAYSSAWEAITNKSPVASVLYSELQTVARLDEITDFSVGLQSVNRPLGDNTTNVATTAFVQTAINNQTPPTAVNANDLPDLSDSSQLIVNSKSLKGYSKRIAVLTEERNSNTNGGIATNGFNLRYLNTYKDRLNQGEVVTGFGGTYFTLNPGLYEVSADCVVVSGTGCRLVLSSYDDTNYQNIIEGLTINTGDSSYSGELPNVICPLNGYLTVEDPALKYCLRVWIKLAKGQTTDLGRASGYPGKEIFSMIKLKRID